MIRMCITTKSSRPTSGLLLMVVLTRVARLLDAWNTNNTGSSIPRLSTMNTADEGRASSYYVENGSYLKLRTLQVGYTIPSSILSQVEDDQCPCLSLRSESFDHQEQQPDLFRPRESKLELSTFNIRYHSDLQVGF